MNRLCLSKLSILNPDLIYLLQVESTKFQSIHIFNFLTTVSHSVILLFVKVKIILGRVGLVDLLKHKSNYYSHHAANEEDVARREAS